MARIARQLDRLYEGGKRDLLKLQTLVDRCGASAAPNLRLQRGQEYRYDERETTITILLPDLAAPLGKLFLLYLQELLSCPCESELVEYLTLLQQFGIAHEFAHHLRARYGRFDKADLWLEEQLANRFAAAAIKQRLTPVELRRARVLLARTVAGLQSAERGWTEIARSFDQPDLALQIISDPVDRLPPTRAAIEATMRQSVADYMFYTFGWIYLSLTVPVRESVADWINVSLKVRSGSPSGGQSHDAQKLAPPTVPLDGSLTR